MLEFLMGVYNQVLPPASPDLCTPLFTHIDATSVCYTVYSLQRIIDMYAIVNEGPVPVRVDFLPVRKKPRFF